MDDFAKVKHDLRQKMDQKSAFGFQKTAEERSSLLPGAPSADWLVRCSISNRLAEETTSETTRGTYACGSTQLAIWLQSGFRLLQHCAKLSKTCPSFHREMRRRGLKF
jgi:hypothetical protein